MCAGWSVDPRVGRAPPRDRCIIVETPPGSSVDDPRATATPRNFTPHYLPVICPPEITNAEVRVWVIVYEERTVAALMPVKILVLHHAVLKKLLYKKICAHNIVHILYSCCNNVKCSVEWNNILMLRLWSRVRIKVVDRIWGKGYG